jgi:quercetin dioxygenase-like cupin family protein
MINQSMVNHRGTDMNKRIGFLAAGALTIGLLGGVLADRQLLAQQAPVTRKVLLTTADPGGATHELVMAAVEIVPGGQSGFHRHPGVEIGYVLDGELELQYRGSETVTVTAGQSFRNEGIHNGINRGAKPAKLLAVYAVEKGKPMTEAVP